MAFFHIDQMEAARPASRYVPRGSEDSPAFAAAEVFLPGAVVELEAIPFAWDEVVLFEPETLAFSDQEIVETLSEIEPEPEVVELPVQLADPATEIAAEAATENVEVVEAKLGAEPEAATEVVAEDAEPPEAPAWEHPIPFKEWPLTVPQLEVQGAEEFKGAVLRPVLKSVSLGIRYPKPTADKALGDAPRLVLTAPTWNPPFELPSACMEAKKPWHKPASQQPRGDWHPSLHPVCAPAELLRLAVALPPPVVSDEHRHEVVVNLAALGLFDDAN